MRTRIPLLLMLAAIPAFAGNPAKDLKSKDRDVRLAAVDELRAGGEEAEDLLLKAADDRDWEVVEHAVVALGERGGEDSVKPLLKLAVVGPVRRIRIAAARSLRAIDPVSAAERIARLVTTEEGAAACEALLVLASGENGYRGEEIRKAILRGLDAKERLVRVAAAGGITVFTGRQRQELLMKILKMPETSVRAAALNALRESPDERDLPELVTLLGAEDLNDVLSRRTIAGIVAIVAAAEPGEAADRLARRAVAPGKREGLEPEVAARYARLAGMLAAQPDPLPPEGEDDEPVHPPALVSQAEVMPALETALAHEDPAVRAAAVHALGRIRSDSALDRAAEFVTKDESPRVRLHALRAVAMARGTSHAGTRALLIDRLGKDSDVGVREYAAVALGQRELVDAVSPLIQALADADLSERGWEVAVCAAVSLGKTGESAAAKKLIELAGHRDWKLRGAAIVGLGHVRRKEAVPVLIAALGDKDTAVQASAWESLKRIANRKMEPTVSAWRDWWESVEDGFVFRDLEAEARQAKKYGYALDFRGVYENLDVIVLQSRGDTIEKLLERLEIQHRLTRSGQTEDAGLHPWAVFVANCTGEIVPKDVERLAWFVRTGGYLFGSCWALHETIELVYPGVVQKLPIPGQVLANVIAEPCPTDSRYLEGVFGDGIVRPIYVLYGAHLIDVLDPERVEVLIDSPETADTWPEGNLACWFDAGHGVILDSANHFDLQGLERVDGLKTAEDRMGYAMDHMGLSYADLRELSEKRVWGSRSKAAAEARDLSAFRFITNFVRHKRRTAR